MDRSNLIQAAFAAKERSYAPYSKFHVGAALLAEGGRIYTGCNIENAAFSPTCCAERTAVFKAVSEGERSFLAIAVVGDKDGYLAPCGVCRQVMAEFCDSESFQVILARSAEDFKVYTLKDLLPKAFSADSVTGF